MNIPSIYYDVFIIKSHVELAVSCCVLVVVLPIRKTEIGWIIFRGWTFNDQIININW